MPTADELYQEANCFLCYGITQTQALKIALLRRQVLELDPNADVSPEALLASAACYNCYANGSVGDLLELALLAIIAANPCTPGQQDGLIWGPNPETVDQLLGSGDAVETFLNTLTNGSTYTTLSFGNPTTVTNDVDFSSSTIATSLEFRLLETVGGNFNTNGGGASALESILAPNLVSVGTFLDISSHPLLTAFNFDSLQTIGSDLAINTNPLLLSAVFPALTTVGNSIVANSGGILTLSFPVLSAYPVAGITSDASLLTLNLPACVDDGAGQLALDLPNMTGLVTLNLAALTAVTGTFSVNASPNLSSLTLTSLVTVVGAFDCASTSLVSISLPALTTITTDVTCGSIPTLTSFSAPLWVPTDGTTVDFNADALDIPSVELILRRLVLAGVVACTIDLSGGTNAGTASLSAQGQADVATLGAQVTMNP